VCDTYRFRGHHVGDVDRTYYRTKEEEERWRAERDPIALHAAWLRERGLADEAGLERVDREVDDEVSAAVERAVQAPFPDPDEVEEHVYA
jgi:pyruvate dehydrogenase E1 component alpha subunit